MNSLMGEKGEKKEEVGGARLSRLTQRLTAGDRPPLSASTSPIVFFCYYGSGLAHEPSLWAFLAVDLRSIVIRSGTVFRP